MAAAGRTTTTTTTRMTTRLVVGVVGTACLLLLSLSLRWSTTTTTASGSFREQANPFRAAHADRVDRGAANTELGWWRSSGNQHNDKTKKRNKKSVLDDFYRAIAEHEQQQRDQQQRDQQQREQQQEPTTTAVVAGHGVRRGNHQENNNNNSNNSNSNNKDPPEQERESNEAPPEAFFDRRASSLGNVFFARAAASSSSSSSSSSSLSLASSHEAAASSSALSFTPRDPVLYHLLASVSDDAGTQIKIIGTPQQLAYFWLESIDIVWHREMSTTTKTTSSRTSSSLSVALRAQMIQRYAMAVLYFALHGADWEERYQWLFPNVPACQWGDDNNNTTTTTTNLNAACSSNQDVIRLEFYHNRLVGELPPELGLLTHLERLILVNDDPSDNTNPSSSLSGTIPSRALEALVNLQELNLSGNPDLIGSIPPAVCSTLRPSVATIDCTSQVSCTCCNTCDNSNSGGTTTDTNSHTSDTTTTTTTDAEDEAFLCVDQGPEPRITLGRGDFLCSPSQRYRFGLSVRGTLELCDNDNGQVLFLAPFRGNVNNAMTAEVAVFQRDGNFAAYAAQGEVLFSSKTHTNDPNTTTALLVTDSGEASIVRNTTTTTNNNNDNTVVVWTTAWFPPIPPPPVFPVPPSEYDCVVDAGEGPWSLPVGSFICSPWLRYRFGLVDGGLYGGATLQMRATTTSTTSSSTSSTTTTTDDIIWTTEKWGGIPTGLPLFTSHYEGCFLDDAARSFGRQVQVPFVKWDVDTCALECWVRGFEYFGVQHYEECFCGTSTEYNTALVPADDEAQCNTPCTVNPAQICGGAWRNSVYRLDTTPNGATDLVLELTADGSLQVTNQLTNERLYAVGIQETHGDATTLLVDDFGVASVCRAVTGCTWSTATSEPNARVGTATLHNRIMTGYQGWFFTYGDRGVNDWQHWSQTRSRPPEPGNLVFEMWPDLQELEDDEKFETNLVYANGTKAAVFSSYVPRTVERHTRWMKEYGLHGVFVQRFVNEIAITKQYIDQVLRNVRLGCEKYGRAFVNMYDIANGLTAELVQVIIDDWKHLVDTMHITKSNMYLHHNGAPLVAIWGIGFHDVDAEVEHVNALLDFFQNDTDSSSEYRASVMAGVPIGWRDLSWETQKGADWEAAFRRFDVLSPWTIGRYKSNTEADFFRQFVLEPDLAECESLGIDYMPVAFPGFSLSNLKADKEFNFIPRNGGTFFWRQLYNIMDSGNNMLYVAMFDEVDEATAIFKVAASSDEVPVGVNLLSLNDDPGYDPVPNDWYLQLTGAATRYMQYRQVIPEEMPQPGSAWLEFVNSRVGDL